VTDVTSLWTKLTVLLFALDGIGGLYAIFAFELPQIGVFYMLAVIELAFVLAVVAWGETKLGAMLVILLGLILFTERVILASLNLIPEWGPQWGQYLWSIIYLMVSAFSYLSYTKIQKQAEM
jgi:hypothetical protein